MVLLWVATGLLFLAVGGYGLALVLRRPLQQARRREVLASPFPGEWEEIVAARCKFYDKLTPDLRERLQRHMQVFLAEKRFEACGGLERVTEEMKVVIAAQACLLLIGLKRHDYFCSLSSILVYPGAFRRGRERMFPLLEEDPDEADAVLLGESWSSGSVVIAWENALNGALNEDDGQNVVLHEFAHQLDQADGLADGAPILNSPGDYKDWARVLGHDFEKLVAETEAGKRELIDSYGATNPAEFFAVATETFFEKPRRLREKHRALYDELSQYYGLDPANWQ